MRLKILEWKGNICRKNKTSWLDRTQSFQKGRKQFMKSSQGNKNLQIWTYSKLIIKRNRMMTKIKSSHKNWIFPYRWGIRLDSNGNLLVGQAFSELGALITTFHLRKLGKIWWDRGLAVAMMKAQATYFETPDLTLFFQPKTINSRSKFLQILDLVSKEMMLLWLWPSAGQMKGILGLMQ